MTDPVPTQFPADNPFASPSTLPFGLPPFAEIRDEHFEPAFEAGMAEQLGEVQAIIRKRPQLFADLIRELKNLPDHSVLRVVREVRDGNW